jgi:hypothetical protein
MQLIVKKYPVIIPYFSSTSSSEEEREDGVFIPITLIFLILQIITTLIYNINGQVWVCGGVDMLQFHSDTDTSITNSTPAHFHDRHRATFQNDEEWH